MDQVVQFLEDTDTLCWTSLYVTGYIFISDILRHSDISVSCGISFSVNTFTSDTNLVLYSTDVTVTVQF